MDEKIFKQEIYTYEEYKEKFPDNMIYYKGKYYCELEDLKEYNELIDEPIYGTYGEIITVDIELAIDDAESNSNVEDFEFNNKYEIIDFVNEWNERNAETIYCVDYSVIIE